MWVMGVGSPTGWRVGSGCVRPMNICSWRKRCRAGSSSASGISMMSRWSISPWVIQSLFWNWIHDAARRLRKGTSSIVSPRVSSLRLIKRGLGDSSSSSVGRRIDELATLRGNRVPAAPSFGLSRLFQLPSAVRKWVTPGGGVRWVGANPVLASRG